MFKDRLDLSSIGLETGDLADGLDIGGLIDRMTDNDPEVGYKLPQS